MQKIIHDETGPITISQSGKLSPGIVCITHGGGVIVYWEVRDVDGQPCAEMKSVHDRLAHTDCSDQNIMQAIRLGQKLADLLISFGETEKV